MRSSAAAYYSRVYPVDPAALCSRSSYYVDRDRRKLPQIGPSRTISADDFRFLLPVHTLVLRNKILYRRVRQILNFVVTPNALKFKKYLGNTDTANPSQLKASPVSTILMLYVVYIGASFMFLNKASMRLQKCTHLFLRLMRRIIEMKEGKRPLK
jgi:hypothetical protein